MTRSNQNIIIKISTVIVIQISYLCRECNCGSRSCAFNGAYANVGPGPLPGLPSRLRILTCLSPNDADAVGIVTHELLHNMGLLHTHTRADRDEYVRYVSANKK